VSKSNLDDDVAIDMEGGVIVDNCSVTAPYEVESFRDSLRKVSGGAGLVDPRCFAAVETPILDGGLGRAISEFEMRSRCIWFGFILGGKTGCCSRLKSPKIS